MATSVVTDRPMKSAPKLLSIADAADALAISRRSVWRLISQSELGTVRLGRRVLIPTASIDALIARGGAA